MLKVSIWLMWKTMFLGLKSQDWLQGRSHWWGIAWNATLHVYLGSNSHTFLLSWLATPRLLYLEVIVWTFRRQTDIDSQSKICQTLQKPQYLTNLEQNLWTPRLIWSTGLSSRNLTQPLQNKQKRSSHSYLETWCCIAFSQHSDSGTPQTLSSNHYTSTTQ